MLHAQHLDPVAAVGDDLAHRLLGRHQAALLIDHDGVERLGEADVAAVGREFAGEQLEQRRLARAVAADDADPVAPRDAQREVLSMMVRSPKLFEMPLASMTIFERASSVPVVTRLAEPCGPIIAGAFGAHLDQLGQPPLIALAPPGDAAQQPMLLKLELGIEPLGVARLVGIDLLGPGIEAAEADLGAPDRAAIEPQASAWSGG